MQLAFLSKRDQLEVHRFRQQVPQHLPKKTGDAFLCEMIDDPVCRRSRSGLGSPVEPQGGLATAELDVELFGRKEQSLPSKADTSRSDRCV